MSYKTLTMDVPAILTEADIAEIKRKAMNDIWGMLLKARQTEIDSVQNEVAAEIRALREHNNIPDVTMK